MAFSYRFDAEAGLDVVEGTGLSIAVRRLGAEAVSLTWHTPDLGSIGLSLIHI